jgi:NTP pyrophosphatase (non-canonical NTP hydrolase)
MDLNEYQKAALFTASYPNIGNNLLYPALGLVGEAGETADKIKKYWRNFGKTKGSELDSNERSALIAELGDVLWYVGAMASELGATLEYVAEFNVEKLRARQKAGTIKGEGDNR